MSFVRQASLQSRKSSAIFKISLKHEDKKKSVQYGRLTGEASYFAKRQREFFVTKAMPFIDCYVTKWSFDRGKLHW